MKSIHRPTSVAISLIATFAALNVIANFVPVSPVLGFDSRLTLGWIFSPLAGLMLGPFAGGLSCLLATLIGLYVGQPVLALGPAGFFSSALAAFQTGLLVSGRWKLASIILGVLVTGWLALPTGRESAPILVFHLFGLALMLTLRGRMKQYLSSNSRRAIGLSVSVTTYCGNINRHLYGNLILVIMAGLPPGIFLLAIPFTLVEQLFFSFASFVLGTSLIRLKLRQVTYIG